MKKKKKTLKIVISLAFPVVEPELLCQGVIIRLSFLPATIRESKTCFFLEKSHIVHIKILQISMSGGSTDPLDPPLVPPLGVPMFFS
ncbi:hypothetical protein HanRHA438_Chr17g0841131 [Helianthus annuus]|nr:hypothetical protein HanRHA438_Chr17g0841131 [Helianthus annuus]